MYVYVASEVFTLYIQTVNRKKMPFMGTKRKRKKRKEKGRPSKPRICARVAIDPTRLIEINCVTSRNFTRHANLEGWYASTLRQALK